MPMNRDHHDQLIAFVCRTMADDEREAFAQRVADEAELAAEVAALREVLSPLDQWRAPEPSTGLTDAIMARVATASPLEVVAESAPLTPVAMRPTGRRLRITLPQVFAVAASIALLLSILVPTVQRGQSQRVQQACLHRIAQLGQGISQYAEAYGGMLPRVATSNSQDWLNQPQRLHMEPAVRLRFITPRDLTCPSGGDSWTSGMDAQTDRVDPEQDFREFLKRGDVMFYSVQHYPQGPVQWRARVRMPRFADANPLVKPGQVLEGVTPDANSPAHEGRGQNVLFNDGSAEFLERPQFQEADNIWRPENNGRLRGTEAPVSATDSFLIP
jgi:hypothetical protein